MAHDIVARRSSRGSCIALAAIAAALSAVPLRAQAPCLEASRRFARPPSRVLEAGPELAHDAFLLPVDSDEFFDELSMEQHGTTWHSPLAHLEPSPEYVDELVRALADPARRHAAACDAGILAQMPIEPNLALRLAEAIAAARDGTPGAALDFAFAAVQLALGKHVAVLGDRRVALSTDPLVRYQYTKARFAAGDAAPATEALRALHFGGDLRVRLNLLWDVFPILSYRDLEWAKQGPLAAEAFWRWLEGRAGLSGFSLDDWLAEFYSRLEHANVNCWGYRPRKRDAPRWRPLDRDPRREVYLRYGKPIQTIVTPVFGDRNLAYETWRYMPLDAEGGPLLIHFMRGMRWYRLTYITSCRHAERLATLSKRIGAQFRRCMRPKQFSETRLIDYADRHEVGELYDAAFSEYRHRAVQREWPFTYAVYAFAADPARPARGTLVTAFLQVPANEHASGQGRVHFAVVDTLATRAWASGGTIAVGEARAIETVLHVPLDSGSTPQVYRISVRDERDPATAMAYGGPLSAPTFPDGVLAISDVVPLHPDGASPWRRGDHVLRPMFGGARERAMDIYYELYHVSPGEQLETTIRIEREGGLLRRARRYEVRFDDVVPDSVSVPTLAQRRTRVWPPARPHAACGAGATLPFSVTGTRGRALGSLRGGHGVVRDTRRGGRQR